MKFGRFFDPEGAEQVGVVTDKRVTVLEGPDILSAAGFSAMVLDRAGTAEEGATYDLEAVQLLAPLRPPPPSATSWPSKVTRPTR